MLSDVEDDTKRLQNDREQFRWSMVRTDCDSISRAGPKDYRLGTSEAAIATAAPHVVPSAVFRARGKDARLSRFYGVHAARPSIFHPLLILRADSRRDFVAIVFRRKKLAQACRYFPGRSAGLKLYDIGLSSTHPIITAAVLNLSPFWAALIAAIVSKRSISFAVASRSSPVSSSRSVAPWRLRGARSMSTARFWRATFSRASSTANGFTRCRCRHSSL